jgi:four helix bundle protein
MGRSSYQNLIAWKRARHLVRLIYQVTDTFPRHERYILSAQMRRAALSVPSNLAEGHGRLSNGEWQQFLGQARGSLMELESDVIVTFDLGYASREELAPLMKRIRECLQLINGLLRASAKGFEAKKYKPVNR